MSTSNPNLAAMLGAAGKALGADPGTLENTLRSGKLDEILGKMDAKDASVLRQAMENPEIARKLLASPQARELMKKFSQK